MGRPTVSSRIDPELRGLFPEFADAMVQQLEHGAVEYGDKSLHGPAVNAVFEAMEEAIDAAAWSFICFYKLSKLAKKTVEAEDLANARLEELG
jgi:hypothetical protein